MNIEFPTESEVIAILKRGGIGVLPTDTLYGIVGSALSEETVEKIYVLRKRDLQKPMIILIPSFKELALFGIAIDTATKNILESVWPGKVSVVLDCLSDEFAYLHRGKRSLAFRVPDDEWLRNLLIKTGPLVAPSANFEGCRSAETIVEAKAYFGDEIAFYFDRGVLYSKPSTIIKIKEGKIEILRQGAEKLDR